MMQTIVAGSGPAGVSCAMALLRQGASVTMLDWGVELEDDRKTLLRSFQSRPFEEWSEGELATLKSGMAVDTKHIPLKLAYGSNFPYRDAPQFIPMETRNNAIVPALAKGGLSNVWGGAVLPYRDADIQDWPIASADLESAYRSVLSFVDLVAVKDDLEEMFPLYSTRYHALKPSRQATSLFDDLRRHEAALKAEHFRFGASRLAMRAYAAQGRSGCIYCGCCLYGCPHELIYNATATLADLSQHAKFRYIGDAVVKRLVESGGRVRIWAESKKADRLFEWETERLFLACGPLATTRILLESMEVYDRPLTLRDSQYFLLPALRFSNVPQVVEEDLHTLCQAFIEILDETLSRHTIHLQVYTYNDLYRSVLQKQLGRWYSPFSCFANPFLGRLLTIQGYLHSELSPTVHVSLHRREKGEEPLLRVIRQEKPAAAKTIRLISRKLMANRKYLRFIPLSPWQQIGLFGHGFHTGGTFPMRERPGDFECDTLGRPAGFDQVHLVDSTTFPSIPATTITLTVMANAYRIAEADCQL